MCMYYGYIRVSTDSQAERGGGLDVQRQAIMKYAKDHNITIALPLFCDAGVSGTLENRPALDELLIQTIKEGDCIIVHNTSRLWRSIFAQAAIMKAVINAKANIISIDEPSFDVYKYMKDPENFMITGMLGMLDQWERMTIARKLARGRKQKARTGAKPAGVCPYGYGYSTDKKSVVIVEDEALVVKRIFAEALNGRSLGKIAEGLNADGLKTRRGAWTPGGLALILHNHFYTGMLTHDGTTYTGTHEPIISKITFGKVQAQLGKRQRNKA